MHTLRSLPKSWNAQEMPGPRSLFLGQEFFFSDGRSCQRQWATGPYEVRLRQLGEREEYTVFSLSNFSLAHITDIAFIFMCPLGPWVFYFLFQYQLVFSRLLAWSKLFAFIENNTLPPPPFFLKIHRVLKIPLVSPSFLSSSPSDKPNSILCSLPQEKLERAG